MARASEERTAGDPRPAARLLRGPVVFALAGAVGLIAAAALLRVSSGGETPPGAGGPDPGPVHVHGLGVDPADGALFVATHAGLYRVGADERTAERVGGRYQDTMGFTVVGPHRFLGSGHPDLVEAREQGLPPLLGLIESSDAGESWQPLSLAGEADFHVLRPAGRRVYGYDASNDRLLVSADGGRSWRRLATPGPLVDLAVDPRDERRLVVASAGGPVEGLFASGDGGASWTRVGEAVGLLAWPRSLYLVVGDGRVFASRDGGRSLEGRGEIGGQPAALLAAGPGELYVALHDGTIERSVDGGATWTVRSTP